MESINTNLSQTIIQQTLNGVVEKTGINNKQNSFNPNQFCDIGAYSFTPNMLNNALNFDSVMDNVVNFKDMLTYSQDTMAQMRAKGESLLALINKAHGEDQTPESLEAINAEAAARVAEIEDLFRGANFNGINPFQGAFGVTIPNWQDVLQQFAGIEPAAEDEEIKETENAITNTIATIDFDFNMSGMFGDSSMDMTASASIQIGFTDEGALQICVDASMDFDLSGIVNNGAESNNAFDIINNFLSMLGVKQNNLYGASNFLDGILGGGISLDDLIEAKEGDSTRLQGKLTQQATITLDGAYQMPSIAINML